MRRRARNRPSFFLFPAERVKIKDFFDNCKCRIVQPEHGKQQIYVVTLEILVQPGELSSGNTKGFTNVVTWADSPRTAQQKVSEVLKSYGWELLGIEAARPYDASRSYDDDIQEIVDQAMTNPNACIIGTVFSYKPE